VAKSVLSVIEPIAITFSVWPPVVSVVNLKLPTEVRNLCRWSDHVHVIPPSRWCAANPLSFLSISEEVGQLKTSVWPWMVPANEDAVVALFVILDIAQGSCDPADEIAFEW